MLPENQSLILEQRVVKRANDALHCREISLRLSEDQRELILSRYLEQYSHDGVQWVERTHRVPVTTMLNWLIAHGEGQTLVHGDDTSQPIQKSAVRSS